MTIEKIFLQSQKKNLALIYHWYMADEIEVIRAVKLSGNESYVIKVSLGSCGESC